MKELFNKKLGDAGQLVIATHDGLISLELSFGLGGEHEVVKLSAEYPAEKLLEPTVKFVKELVPGSKFDGYVDDLASAALKYFGISKAQATKPE